MNYVPNSDRYGKAAAAAARAVEDAGTEEGSRDYNPDTEYSPSRDSTDLVYLRRNIGNEVFPAMIAAYRAGKLIYHKPLTKGELWNLSIDAQSILRELRGR